MWRFTETMFGKGQESSFDPKHRGLGVSQIPKYGLDGLESNILGKIVENLDSFSTANFFKTCKKVHDDKVLRGAAEGGLFIREVSCGEAHTMLLYKSSELYVCGHNGFGQLGLGDREDRDTFERVRVLPVGLRIKQVVCGTHHTMLLSECRELYVCGSNGAGQLGLGNKEDRDTFTRVKGLPAGMRIEQLICGGRHSVLLCGDGELYVCGLNHHGELGLGDRENRDTFTGVKGLPAGVRIKQLVCGERHTILLYVSGALYVCGSNDHGQLGLGDKKDRDAFTRIEALPADMHIKQMICSDWGTLLISESGELYFSFSDSHNFPGLGDENRYTFVRFEGFPVGVRVRQLEDGEHTVRLSESGELYVRGSNDHGQLGLGDKLNRDTFTRVEGLPRWDWANISTNDDSPSMSMS